MEPAPGPNAPPGAKPPLYRVLYVQVLFAIACGVLLGHLAPSTAVTMKPLGDGFIKLIKMVIGPIILVTIVGGVAGMRDLRKVGRVGGKALLYFEVLTTLALVIGLTVVNLLEPGVGMNADVKSLDASALSAYTTAAKNQGVPEFLLGVIPDTLLSGFVKGEILQVLLVSVLTGSALAALGPRGERIAEAVDDLGKLLFQIVGFVMKLAPIGAFGAMAFTIGKYGIDSLAPLAKLMLGFYVTCVLFVLGVLGLVARWAGFSILRFIVYIRDELLIVLGTSSSETVLPRIMVKLEQLGCSKSVVGLVIPTGYSFNLDGTSIYLTMAAVFVAQATNTPLTLGDQLTLLGVLLLTSKGASGVTGAGFVTLAATLSAVPTVPVAGLALILGIDRFMSEARALTNLIGNGVATIAVSKWEGELDEARLRAVMREL
jgi:aerobic C4-dicarboxylate transport protein